MHLIPDSYSKDYEDIKGYKRQIIFFDWMNVIKELNFLINIGHGFKRLQVEFFT